MLSWEKVRDELVEAVRFSWRMPGAMPSAGGRATDGPWHLILPQSLADGEFDAWRREREEQIARDLRGVMQTVPLNPEQVTWMEQRFDWLRLIADRDRKLVWLACVQLAGEAGVISWARIRRQLSAEIERKGLYRRYVRALQGLAKALNECALKAAA
jgi:hypothetical protein